MARVAHFRGRAVRFAAVGVASTILYLLIFVMLRGSLGAQLANFTALLLSAVANTMLNKRLTFGLAGRTGPREQAQGLAVFALGAALTSGALSVLHAADPSAGRLLEVTVLVAATAVATVVRFILFSRWVFAPPAPGAPPPNPSNEAAGPSVR